METVINEVGAFKRVYRNEKYDGSEIYKDYYKTCELSGFLRKAPPHEKGACRKIEQTIWQSWSMWPGGGHTSIMGTPTVHAVSPQYSNNNNILDDNLMVVNAAVKNSDMVDVFIGSAEDEEKAMSKAHVFNMMDSVSGSSVWVGPVTKNSLYYVGSKMSRKHDIEKIILLTSGTWNGSKESKLKYDFDVNFEAAAKELTDIYKNIYIMAMVYSHPGFKVLYMHNKTIEEVVWTD